MYATASQKNLEVNDFDVRSTCAVMSWQAKQWKMCKDWITTKVNGCQLKSTSVHARPGSTKIQTDSSDLTKLLFPWFTGVNMTIQVGNKRSFCDKWFEKCRERLFSF